MHARKAEEREAGNADVGEMPGASSREWTNVSQDAASPGKSTAFRPYITILNG